MAVRRAAGLLSRGDDLPETFSYSLKRRLLGPPLVNDQLGEERLSKPLALGVLCPDGISSSAYGTEEILIELLQRGLGLAAFSVLLPITGVVLLVLILVVLSYREVVMVYTRTGGSYVVARDNFGPKVAQIAAVALLIDYTVTVAVQVAAGAAAIVSAFPALGTLSFISTPEMLTLISVVAILIMCYGNLRGIREAGRAFALPTYLFTGAVVVMIVIGVAREAAGHLATVNPATLQGTYYHGSSGTSLLISFALVLTLLRAFANGGSSLTGIEAVSNAVSALRPPEGRNARQVLVIQGFVLAFLIGGISWLAHVTHATPYTSGAPTVISQEASLVFGGGPGRIMFYFVQFATALILFTGGNTSFNGFPFLASFVAQDAFLPRWLMKRGHRLVFSNGIIVLTVVSLALIVAVGANVNGLVPFYAIGVFTGFAMAGFGMSKYHYEHRERGWRHRLVINFTAGVLTAIVVLIFAVVKFTEGAWLIVIIFPIMVVALILLNGEYRAEADVLKGIGERRAAGVPPNQPNYTRRVVIVFVDDFDLSTIAALRYARSLRPTTLRAVHFVIDTAQAERLRAAWLPDRNVSLEFVDCPDRRLARAAAELVSYEAETPGTQVTAILPRRSFSPLFGRLMHDRTADKMAGVVSRIPNAAATIIPFDVQARVATIQQRQAEGLQAVPVPDRSPQELLDKQASVKASEPDNLPGAGGYDRPTPPPGTDQIGTLTQPGRATVEGRVRVVEIRPVEHNTVLAVEISDSTGDLTALFYGRSRIPGLMCGGKVRLRGQVGISRAGQGGGGPVMVNPAYELLIPGKADKADD